MSIIKPSDFINLKKAVKSECQRRSYKGNKANSFSMADYGSSKYDYIVNPASQQYIQQEHYEKIAIPMNVINKNNTPDTDAYLKVIKQKELQTLQEWVELYSSTNIKNTSKTDCTGGCTGLCFGCTDSCTGVCANSCYSDCTGTCSGDCWARCADSCSGTCTVECGNAGCTGGCQSGCGAEVGGGPSGCAACGSNCSGVSK